MPDLLHRLTFLLQTLTFSFLSRASSQNRTLNNWTPFPTQENWKHYTFQGSLTGASTPLSIPFFPFYKPHKAAESFLNHSLPPFLPPTLPRCFSRPPNATNLGFLSSYFSEVSLTANTKSIHHYTPTGTNHTAPYSINVIVLPTCKLPHTLHHRTLFPL